MVNVFSNAYSVLSGRDNPYTHTGGYFTGYTQMRNTQRALQTQIGYEQYLRQGNERALEDWNRYVGSQGKSIRYPEFSYAGQIRRADTSIARAGLDYDTASANYFGNLPYRYAGLYGIGSKLSRFM